MGHYDLRPNVRGFLAASTPPLFGGNTITFSIDNPYLDPADRATLLANGATSTFQLARNFNDVLEYQGYLERNTVDLYRIVGGFQGDFQAWGEKLNWDLSYDYGRSQTNTNFNYINEDRLLLAMDAVRDAGGNIVCRSGGACVPINLFGENNFSKEAAQYVLDPVQAVNLNTEKVITAKLAGSSLFGLSLAGSYGGISGGFNTKEVYGETVVPLVVDEQNWPVIKNLSFEGAVRYVDNSINGGDTTWSAGGRVSP